MLDFVFLRFAGSITRGHRSANASFMLDLRTSEKSGGCLAALQTPQPANRLVGLSAEAPQNSNLEVEDDPNSSARRSNCFRQKRSGQVVPWIDALPD